MSIISTKYLLQDAQANGYAVPAFNIHNAETIQAILEVCSEMRSPVILAHNLQHATGAASRPPRIAG